MELSSISVLWDELTEEVGEREDSHHTIFFYSMWFPVPVTSLSIWTSKKKFSTKPWKKETVEGNQA